MWRLDNINRGLPVLSNQSVETITCSLQVAILGELDTPLLTDLALRYSIN